MDSRSKILLFKLYNEIKLISDLFDIRRLFNLSILYNKSFNILIYCLF